MRGRRGEEDAVQARVRQRFDRRRLLERAIDKQHAVHARGDRFAREFRIAVDFDRIEIAHQYDRRVAVRLPKLADPTEDLREAYALGERAFAGMLDHGTVGHRIGKWHAEFDRIGAGFDQRVHQRDDAIGRWITRGDEWDQAGAAGGFEFGKTLVDAVHSAIPSRAAIVCTSLSPRPDRLTSTN